ncbi:hypothetical protein ACFW04_014754 [Cataglyphis niger]
MEKTLGGADTYKIITKDPTKKFTSELRLSLYVSDGILPRVYGLPKIHKCNHFFRVIVSSLNSPLYHLASYLHRNMHQNFPKTWSHILNNFQLVDKLSDTLIEDNHILISLDAISLFINIPIELAMDIRFVLDSRYFIFNGTIYQQTFGTPMGSPLSSIIADIVLQDLKEKALTSLNFIPSFYLRYVDDIILSASLSAFEHILNVFNSFHSRLQFTMEIENNNKLDFLTLKYLFNNHNKNNHSPSDEIKETIRKEKFFTIPYVPSISERFKSIKKDLDVRLSYFSLNKYHQIAIYKINCDNCYASYVGQTGRQLQTRIKEHRNHIRHIPLLLTIGYNIIMNLNGTMSK